MKKILPLVLFLSFLSLQAQTGYWSDYAASGFSSGTGTKTDPYQIKTAEELAFLSNQVNSGVSYVRQYFELGDNIDLSTHFWVPIGSSKSFQGKFDGKEKNIDGMFIGTEQEPATYSSIGLFGEVDGEMSRDSINDTIFIKNINLNSGKIIAKNSNVGSIVGYVNVFVYDHYVYDHYSTVISNCKNKVNIKCISCQYIGGIVGFLQNHSMGIPTYVHISNCINYGTITSDTNSHIGGIGGSIFSYDSYIGNQVFELSNCINNGVINGGTIVGGIVGDIDNSVSRKSTFTMIDCVNNAEITGKKDTYASSNVAGIIGISSFYSDGDNSLQTLKRCVNNGNIVGGGLNNSSTSGVIGYINIASISSMDLYVDSCSNNGIIKGGQSKSSYVGGIIAGNECRSGQMYLSVMYIINSSNVGQIIGSGDSISYTGGILGHTGSAIVENNINKAIVVGGDANNSYTGGIVAGHDRKISGLTIANNTNENNVFGTGKSNSCTGGIIGLAEGMSDMSMGWNYVRTTQNKNTGNILGGNAENSYTGGIIGYGRNYDVGADAYGFVTISNSINEGNIDSRGKSQSFAGGIMGYCLSEENTNGRDLGSPYYIDRYNSSISNCINKGNVRSAQIEKSYSGGVIGYGRAMGEGMGQLYIRSSYNCGEISAKKYAGGLAGYLQADNKYSILKLTQSYSRTSITGNPTYAGGLVGGLNKGDTTSICSINSCVSLVDSIQADSTNHRVLGHLEGLSTEANSFETLGNYAWQKNWTGIPGLKTVEGANWDGSMKSQPTSIWNTSLWQCDSTDEYMPKLIGIDLALQPNVKNPLKIFSSIASGLSTSSVQGGKGFILVKDANSGARIEVFGLSGMRVISKQIETPNTTIPIERGIYIVKIRRETYKVIVQ